MAMTMLKKKKRREKRRKIRLPSLKMWMLRSWRSQGSLAEEASQIAQHTKGALTLDCLHDSTSQAQWSRSNPLLSNCGSWRLMWQLFFPVPRTWKIIKSFSTSMDCVLYHVYYARGSLLLTATRLTIRVLKHNKKAVKLLYTQIEIWRIPRGKAVESVV